jgi:hypothetical protein
MSYDQILLKRRAAWLAQPAKRETNGPRRISRHSTETLAIAALLSIWFALVFLLGATSCCTSPRFINRDDLPA